MIKKAPNLILKYSCSATTKFLHYGATRISRALKSLVFKQISPMMSISGWLITCVDDFDTSFIINNHANRCGLRREWDRGKSAVKVGRIMTGIGTSQNWCERNSTHMHDEAGGKVERIHLLKIWNLQLQRRFRAFSSRYLEANWRPEDTWAVKFNRKILQGLIFNIRSLPGVRYFA